MAGIPNEPGGATAAVPQDKLLQAVDNMHRLRVKLAALRKTNPAEYDRVLRQTFPADVVLLTEQAARECGDRIDALAYRIELLATAFAEEIASYENEGEDDDDEDEGIDPEQAATESAALRTLGEYVRGLPHESLPEKVRAALVVVTDGGLFEDADEDEDEDADEDEPASEGDGEPAGGIASVEEASDASTSAGAAASGVGATSGDDPSGDGNDAST